MNDLWQENYIERKQDYVSFLRFFVQKNYRHALRTHVPPPLLPVRKEKTSDNVKKANMPSWFADQEATGSVTSQTRVKHNTDTKETSEKDL